jgi:hypothetical protein
LTLLRTLVLVGCASRALAQHETHTMNASGGSPPRFHFSATLVHSDHGSLRGERRIGLRDWESFRSTGYFGGHLTFSAMTSLGSLWRDSAGMPSLMQTGGTYRHSYIHDRQHPNELVMEAAAEIWFGRRNHLLYLAPAGSAALGPLPWMHRRSAAAAPVAPIGHHWQDATHVSHGVVGLSLRWVWLTLEATAFNARESDYKWPWPDFSHGRLDSFAGRASSGFGPLSVGAWWGYLKHHDPIAPEMQLHRYGASASFDRGPSSTLAVWGMNTHHHDGSSHLVLHGDPDASPHVRSSSVLLESNLGLGSKTAIFCRAERVMKNGEELGFSGGNLMALYDVRALSLGARRDVASTKFARFSLGARGSISFLPSTLELAYGTRRPSGLDLFLQARRATLP